MHQHTDYWLGALPLYTPDSHNHGDARLLCLGLDEDRVADMVNVSTCIWFPSTSTVCSSDPSRGDYEMVKEGSSKRSGIYSVSSQLVQFGLKEILALCASGVDRILCRYMMYSGW